MKTFFLHQKVRTTSLHLFYALLLGFFAPIGLYGQSCTVLTAVEDMVTTDEETPIAINVLLNDCDPSGPLDTSNLTVLTFPEFGLLNIVTDFPYTVYEPYLDYCGTDMFIYQVCDDLSNCETAMVSITVNCVNDAPIAFDDSFTTTSGVTEIFSLIANDTDVDAEPLDPCNVSLVVPPSNGIFEINPGMGCQASYAADFGYCGTDSFTYQICDVANACATARVDFVINCLNNPPVANDDYVSVSPGAPKILNVHFNDFDSEDGAINPCTAELIVQPSNGIIIQGSSCELIYFPNAYCGNDFLSYSIYDAKGAKDTAFVFITMNCPANTPPEAEEESYFVSLNTNTMMDLVANDSDVEDGSFSPCAVNVIVPPQNGTITITPSPTCLTIYTPNNGYCGTDSFLYEICDSQGSCDQAIVRLNICSSPNYMLDTKVFLAGVLNQGVMRDDLRQAGLVPLVEPYTALGYSRGPTLGGETTTAAILQATGTTAIVDWVLVEFRNKDTPSSLVTTKAVLLRRDGQLVDVDGTFPISVELGVGSEAQIIAIRHRNHLSTISEICFSPCTLDFTTDNAAIGQVLVSADYALQSGSADGDDQIDASDRSETWNLRNTSGYRLADLNMDGIVDAADRSISWNNRNGGVVLP